MKKKILISAGAVLVLLVASAIWFVQVYGPNFNIYLVPPSTKKYGKIALQFIDQNGLYTNSAEWKEAKTAAESNLASAKSYDEVLGILNGYIKHAGGKHSYITTSSQQASNAAAPVIMPTYRVQDDVLILTVPEFVGTQDEAKQYMGILSRAISDEKYSGIIVDLSGNQGGDMSPMIVGLSQTLPDGILFTYVDKHANATDVTLKDGSIDAGGFDLKSPASGKKTDVPIALITNEKTGSSGEMTLLCFRGLPNTRTFGQDTAGYATVNKTFYLYDGASIQITCANVKARTGEPFGEDPIAPDVQTKDAYKDALAWIKQQLDARG
ncbi:MAG: hypothetical protein LBS74_04380 [Oscillospiraceae bacterium]|jgi:C-terminal processing protease CtpA/Prc|nr:hypothetical protein [Oscillospiraceae bacterium]